MLRVDLCFLCFSKTFAKVLKNVIMLQYMTEIPNVCLEKIPDIASLLLWMARKKNESNIMNIDTAYVRTLHRILLWNMKYCMSLPLPFF